MIVVKSSSADAEHAQSTAKTSCSSTAGRGAGGHNHIIVQGTSISAKRPEKKKGFPVARACVAILAQYSSLGLRRCGRLIFPSKCAGAPAGRHYVIPPKQQQQLNAVGTHHSGRWTSACLDKKKIKQTKLGTCNSKAAASSSAARGCPPDLIADCIEFLKKSYALDDLPTPSCTRSSQHDS